MILETVRFDVEVYRSIFESIKQLGRAKEEETVLVRSMISLIGDYNEKLPQEYIDKVVDIITKYAELSDLETDIVEDLFDNNEFILEGTLKN